ncbi:hypothetical protein Tco_0799377 [Tanacetum coccineum]|uniref:Uncharacterized protein n=1 Tax=Tanacetum coccineum TaxID=301880 RepID=A0ABQ4ZQ63_9ASTR
MEDLAYTRDAAPVVLSPGYVPDSDPEEDPEEDSEEEHADYPADGGDGDDEPSDDDTDDDDADVDEEPFEGRGCGRGGGHIKGRDSVRASVASPTIITFTYSPKIDIPELEIAASEESLSYYSRSWIRDRGEFGGWCRKTARAYPSALDTWDEFVGGNDGWGG